MVCKYCRVGMVGGTRYQQNGDGGKNGLSCQSFNQCRSCNDIVLNDSLNFQEH